MPVLRHCTALLAVALLLLLSTVGLSQSIPENGGFQQMSAFENHIHSVCREVLEKGKTVGNLTANDLADLPVGIARQTAGGTIVIAIDSAYSNENGWFLSAYASLTFPGTTRPMAFAAKNIAFNKGGLSSSSLMRLMLASPQWLDINESLDLELPADGRNFVEFDCNGFKAINLKGNFVFSDKILEPDTAVTKDKKRVTAAFEVHTSDLNHMMLAVNITPFKLKGLKDLSFEVKNAIADFSDFANPTGFIFPQEYQQAYGQEIKLWRGFYLQDVTVQLKGFADNQGRDPNIHARNLLIDDMGLSGAFAANNLLSLQHGSADGWPMSIDHLAVKLQFNKVTGGALGGFINVPFLGEDPLGYRAQIEQAGNQLNYQFAIASSAVKEFNTPLGAKIRLDSSSTIAIERQDGRFIPSTLLNGNIIVKNEMLEVSNIRFERLVLTTVSPYVISGVFATTGNSQSQGVGFPVRIDSVNLSVYQGQVGLGFGVALNLMNATDKGFSAATFVQLMARIEESQVSSPDGEGNHVQPARKRHTWKFDKVRVNDIDLAANTTAFSFNGKLSVFNEDPVYGKGFRGSLVFSVKKVLEKGVKVNGYFGSKPTYRYWQADAYLPTAKIPLVAPLSIDGFMGGASYHMVRKSNSTPDSKQLNASAKNSSNHNHQSAIYLPDSTAGVSLMAGVTLIAASEKAFNADAALEIAFNKTGGMRYANFRGEGVFFTSIQDKASSSKSPVYASMNMLYDSNNSTFHANLSTYMNVQGSLRGIGPNGLMGEAIIHVDPKDWYIYIGRSNQMVGVDIAGLAVAQSYFMIGSKIESTPAPPQEVREVFNKINSSQRQDASALAGGRGFATGAHLRMGFDSKDKLMPFYTIMQLGIGADVMLRNYGNVYCAGRSGKVGIDGWYASGQAYVFMNGKVGVRVKRRNFDIMKVGMAALLEAKLPNPTWMSGQLGGNYSVLGGLVKGKFNLKLTVGDECEMINAGNELDDIQIIADLKPGPGDGEVSVFATPQVSFNTSLDTEFGMTDHLNIYNAYRVRLEEFRVAGPGGTLPANIEWNDKKDVAVLRTDKILPPRSTLKVIVKVYWEKKTNNSLWEAVRENGAVIYETKEISFTTGVAPDFVPEENVAYSYPVKNQYNFYIDEHNTGYMQLKSGQDYLFERSQDGTAWEHIVRFQASGKPTLEKALRYNAATSTISFDIPSELQKQVVYKYMFIRRPASSASVDQNLSRNSVIVSSDADNEMSVASNTLEGTLIQNIEKEIYNSAFRTSSFGRVEQKWASLSETRDMMDLANGNLAVIGKRGNLTEMFDELELIGRNDQTPPLMKVVALDNSWLKDHLGPLLYNDYPVDQSIKINWRDPQVLGVKPVRAVKLSNKVSAYKLSDSNISSGIAQAKAGSILIAYYLSYYGYWDFNELRNLATAKYLNNWRSAPEAARKLIVGNYVDLISGSYPVEVSYVLPGINKVTYRTQLDIKF